MEWYCNTPKKAIAIHHPLYLITYWNVTRVLSAEVHWHFLPPGAVRLWKDPMRLAAGQCIVTERKLTIHSAGNKNLSQDCCLQISGSMDPFFVSICVRLIVLRSADGASNALDVMSFDIRCTIRGSFQSSGIRCQGPSEAGVKILDESVYSGHLRFNYSPTWLTKTSAELERGRSLFLITSLVIAW